MLEINADIEITKEAYLIVSKCNITNIEIYLKQIASKLFNNKQIENYLIASCLFFKKDFNTIIILFNKTINNISGIFSVIEILITNYYILSFLYLKLNDMNQVLTILHLVQKQYNSINFYLKYYPQIMIRMLINITEYYSFINDCSFSSDILNTIEFYCDKYELYDSLIDLYLSRLIIAIKLGDYNQMKKTENLIKAYLTQLNLNDKKNYVQAKYDKIRCCSIKCVSEE